MAVKVTFSLLTWVKVVLGPVSGKILATPEAGETVQATVALQGRPLTK